MRMHNKDKSELNIDLNLLKFLINRKNLTYVFNKVGNDGKTIRGIIQPKITKSEKIDLCIIIYKI